MSIFGFLRSRLPIDAAQRRTQESWWRRHPPHVIPRPDPDGVIGYCPLCGIELRRTMMYSCSDSHCPSGLGNRISL